MAMKKCKEWDTFETLLAACPYCNSGVKQTFIVPCEGDKIVCNHCNKTFILGKQE